MPFSELLFGTMLIEMLQRLLSPAFDRIFTATSLLGDEVFLIGLCAIVYWCFDKRRGRLVTYVMFFGAYLNFFLKILITWPRPPVEVRIVEKNDISNGFPSGHAQDSTTFWAWISLDFRKRILPALGTLVVVTVGVSRIYLGVHYPYQVIGGWVIGFAFASLGWLVLKQLPASTGKIRPVGHMIFSVATLIPLVAAVWFGAVGEVNPGLIGGYLLGFSLGTILEDRYVGFKTDISWTRRILRVVVGGAMTGFVAFALRWLLPDTSLVPSFIDSLILGLTVVLIAPAIFKLIERK